MKDMWYYFHDCETGGLSVDCSLLTYYGVCLDENFKIHSEIDLAIKALDGKYTLEARAMDVNKIDIHTHDLYSLPFPEASKKFFTFLDWLPESKPILCGQNVQFDNRFMEKNFPGALQRFSKYSMDTASIGIVLTHMGKLPKNEPLSLEFLAGWYKIDVQKAHNAKNDTWTTIEVYKSMLKDLQGL